MMASIVLRSCPDVIKNSHFVSQKFSVEKVAIKFFGQTNIQLVKEKILSTENYEKTKIWDEKITTTIPRENLRWSRPWYFLQVTVEVWKIHREKKRKNLTCMQVDRLTHNTIMTNTYIQHKNLGNITSYLDNLTPPGVFIHRA